MFKINKQSLNTRVDELKKTITHIEKEIDSHLFQEAMAKMLNAMTHILSLGASLPGFMPYDDSASTLTIQRLQKRLETTKTELILIEQKMGQLSQKANDFNDDVKDRMHLHLQLK